MTTVVITSGTSWTVPSDWNSASNSVACYGAGGGGAVNGSGSANGGAGGGGGAYGASTNLTLTANSGVTVAVGASGTGAPSGSTTAAPGTAGGSTFFGGATLAASTVAGAGGSGGTVSNSAGGAGGTTANSKGATTFAGGAGGKAGTYAAGGGGGGAGASGAGGAGGAGNANSQNAGGGGGANGGTAGVVGGASGTSGGAGGAPTGGTGGAGATSSAVAGAGTNGGGGGGGSDSSSFEDGGAGGSITNGPGGGGGGGGEVLLASNGNGGAGAGYGGGGGGTSWIAAASNGAGGNGGAGAIVVTYTTTGKNVSPTGVSSGGAVASLTDQANRSSSGVSGSTQVNTLVSTDGATSTGVSASASAPTGSITTTRTLTGVSATSAFSGEAGSSGGKASGVSSSGQFSPPSLFQVNTPSIGVASATAVAPVAPSWSGAVGSLSAAGAVPSLVGKTSVFDVGISSGAAVGSVSTNTTNGRTVPVAGVSGAASLASAFAAADFVSVRLAGLTSSSAVSQTRESLSAKPLGAASPAVLGTAALSHLSLTTASQLSSAATLGVVRPFDGTLNQPISSINLTGAIASVHEGTSSGPLPSLATAALLFRAAPSVAFPLPVGVSAGAVATSLVNTGPRVSRVPLSVVSVARLPVFTPDQVSKTLTGVYAYGVFRQSATPTMSVSSVLAKGQLGRLSVGYVGPKVRGLSSRGAVTSLLFQFPHVFRPQGLTGTLHAGTLSASNQYFPIPPPRPRPIPIPIPRAAPRATGTTVYPGTVAPLIADFTVNNTPVLQLDTAGNFLCGGKLGTFSNTNDYHNDLLANALASNAATGFLYIPTVSGAPTATPTETVPGAAPLAFDTSSNVLRLWSGTNWIALASFGAATTPTPVPSPTPVPPSPTPAPVPVPPSPTPSPTPSPSPTIVTTPVHPPEAVSLAGINMTVQWVGSTQHVAFYYDTSSYNSTDGQNIGMQFLQQAETVYSTLQGWFNGMTVVNANGMQTQNNPNGTLVNVFVSAANSTNGGGALHASCANADIGVLPVTGDLMNVGILLGGFAAELSEVFMTNLPGFQYCDTWSMGEGMSCAMAQELYNIDTSASFANDAWVWMDQTDQTYGQRGDYVNNNVLYGASVQGLGGPGCNELFYFYMRRQLNYSWPQITAATAGLPTPNPNGTGPSTPNIRNLYANLTGDAADPFPAFSTLINNKFPIGTAVGQGFDPSTVFPA